MGNRDRLLALAHRPTSNNSNGALSGLLGGESNDVNHVIIQAWLHIRNYNFKRKRVRLVGLGVGGGSAHKAVITHFSVFKYVYVQL